MRYSCKTIFNNGYDEAKLISSSLVTPDVYMVYNLNIAPNERVVALKWLIYEDGLPIAYDEKYLPYFAGINISEKSLKYKDFSELVKNKISVYEMYQDLRIDPKGKSFPCRFLHPRRTAPNRPARRKGQGASARSGAGSQKAYSSLPVPVPLQANKGFPL